MKDSNVVRRQVSREAAEWLVRERDGELTPEERGALAEWLATSTVHIEEYLAASVAWGLLAQGPVPGESVRELVEQARLEPESTNVVPVRAAGLAPQANAQPDARADARAIPPRGSAGRHWRALAATIAIVSLFAWGAVRLLPAVWGSRYATGVGEQRTIMLADGSVLTLNTNSTVRVRFSGNLRQVDLLAGEGRFQVARDPGRPFVVDANGTSVRAIGTVFDVRLGRSETRVAVIEGHVAVDLARPQAKPRGGAAAAGSGPPHVELRAGEQVAVNAGAGLIESRPGDLESVTAWMDRRLVFRDARLSDVIAEFNRYRTHPLTIDDATVAGISISGVFHIDDPDSLMTYLENYEGVQVTRDEDGSEHIRRGRAAGAP